MKKLIVLTFCVLFAAACTDKSKKDDKKIEQAVKKIDSIETEVKKDIEAIDSKIKEVEKELKELDNI